MELNQTQTADLAEGLHRVVCGCKTRRHRLHGLMYLEMAVNLTPEIERIVIDELQRRGINPEEESEPAT